MDSSTCFLNTAEGIPSGDPNDLKRYSRLIYFRLVEVICL